MKNRILMTIAAAGLLVGCDYKVALEKAPKQIVSDQILGTWQWKDRDTQLFITKLDDHYYYAGVRGGPGVTVCHAPVDGMPLVQTEAVASREMEVFVKYGYIRAELTNSELRVAVLNPTIIPETISSSEELRDAIQKNRNQRKLFVEQAVFLKTSDKLPDDFVFGLKKIRPIYEAIHKGEKVDPKLMRE